MSVFQKVSAPKDFPAEIEAIFTKMKDILIKKNKMYGNSSMDLGLAGNYVHLHDKMKRYNQLLELTLAGNAKEIEFEGLEDTLMDIIGYATLGLIIFKQQMSEPTGKTIDVTHKGQPLMEHEKSIASIIEQEYLANMDNAERFYTSITSKYPNIFSVEMNVHILSKIADKKFLSAVSRFIKKVD